MLTITLDWLAMTFKNGDYNESEFLRKFARTPTVVFETAYHGYTTATRDENGVQVSWNSDRKEMGLHAVFSGSALRNLIERSGISPQTLLSEALHAGASITRLDLAKDAQDVPIDLDNIYQALKEGQNLGTARTYGKIESSAGGFTVYIGSRTSEKFIRIYNKAAEQNIQGVLWFRMEIETKGMVARAIASSLDRSRDWSSVFDTVAKTMVRFESSKDYEAFHSSDSVEVGLPKIERHSDTEFWIASQVIPAVSRHYAENRSSDAVAKLLAILTFIKDNQA